VGCFISDEGELIKGGLIIPVVTKPLIGSNVT
jgi:hypothetical protein